MMKYYPHQQHVSDLLLAGHNVILQAPTGAGKTVAALLPFLESWHDLSDAYGALPLRCIYAVPMRILATQFKVEYEKIINRYAVQAGLPKIEVKIQTGENQDDREFSGNLIFATIDQVLSSFLIAPYSLSKRKANLNAGAVVTSYLVFDEFHLFDPETTLPTTLHMLKMLKGIAPFLLMTATFSSTMLEKLAGELDAVIVGHSEAERQSFRQLPSQKKRRFYHVIKGTMTPEVILANHDKRTLVICNTISRARDLYNAIKAQADEGTEVLLLHSQLLPTDRREREDKIREVFGKEVISGDYIVVSTQAIEVGVDISSRALHTELAPANAIIQRSGRCARYADEVGHVHIYRDALKAGEVVDLRDDIMPYEGQSDVIRKTWEAFSRVDGQTLDFDGEQTILDEAHAEQDARIINRMKEGKRSHRQKMYSAMRGEEDARNLIRYIMSQAIVIHDNPHEVARNPFDYPTFNLHPSTVQKHLKEWLDRAEVEGDVSLIRLCEDERDIQKNEERYEVLKVNDAKAGWMTMLVVHPRLATYDPELGFIAEYGGRWTAQLDHPETIGDEFALSGLRLETYEEHITQVYAQFLRFWPEVAWGAKQIERRYGWQQGSLTEAAKLAILFHDVGKLSVGWQKWARSYQNALADVLELEEKRPQSGIAYAHTEFNPRNPDHKEAESRVKVSRPYHAVEGALAVAPVVRQALGNDALFTAVFSAIARHHGPFSQTLKPFKLVPDAVNHISATLPDNARIDLSHLHMRESRNISVDGFMADPQGNRQPPGTYNAYLLIVRALRRADSKGTELGRLFK